MLTTTGPITYTDRAFFFAQNIERPPHAYIEIPILVRLHHRSRHPQAGQITPRSTGR